MVKRPRRGTGYSSTSDAIPPFRKTSDLFLFKESGQLRLLCMIYACSVPHPFSLSPGGPFHHKNNGGETIQLNIWCTLWVSVELERAVSCFYCIWSLGNVLANLYSALVNNAVTGWEYIASMMNEWVQTIDGISLEKKYRSTRRKPCSSDTLSHYKFFVQRPGINP